MALDSHFYKSPTSVLEISYPNAEERHIVRFLPDVMYVRAPSF